MMARGQPPHPRNDAGMSLIAVMLALVVAGITVTVVNQMLQNNRAASQSLDLETEELALRKYVIQSTNCLATFSSGSCSTSSNAWVEVQSFNSAKPILVQKFDTGVTKIGQFQLRARCVTCTTCTNGKKLIIEAAAVTASGTIRKDPLSAKSHDWHDLNRGIPLACVVP